MRIIELDRTRRTKPWHSAEHASSLRPELLNDAGGQGHRNDDERCERSDVENERPELERLGALQWKEHQTRIAARSTDKGYERLSLAACESSDHVPGIAPRTAHETVQRKKTQDPTGPSWPTLKLKSTVHRGSEDRAPSFLRSTHQIPRAASVSTHGHRRAKSLFQAWWTTSVVSGSRTTSWGHPISLPQGETATTNN